MLTPDRVLAPGILWYQDIKVVLTLRDVKHLWYTLYCHGIPSLSGVLVLQIKDRVVDPQQWSQSMMKNYDSVLDQLFEEYRILPDKFHVEISEEDRSRLILTYG